MKKTATTMSRSCAAGTGFLFVFLMLFAPLPALAENIEVTPEEMDYGKAWVGDPKAEVFVLESMGPTPLMVFSVEVTDDPTSSFSITDMTPIPPELDPGETMDVEVAFSPTAEGNHSARITIVCNDRETPILWVPLTGEGLIPWGAASTVETGPWGLSRAAGLLFALLVPAAALLAWRVRKGKGQP